MFKFLLNPYLIGGIAIAWVASVGFAGIKGYNWGVERTDIKWQTVIANDKAEFEERQRKAAEEANKDIKELQDEKDAADALIAELRAQALADPNANRISLGIDSVRRLRSIK